MRRYGRQAWRLLPLVLPLLLAVGLRVWQSDLTPFLDDEAVLAGSAARMLATHQVPLEAGLALAIHVNEPPLVVFLDAIPLLISGGSVIFLSAFMTAVDGLGCIWIFLAGRRLAGPLAGSAGATLYAVAPAAIYFSRRIYYSELVPFLCALMLWALIDVWQRGSGRSLAIAFGAAACATELHATAAVLLVVWLGVALATLRKVSSYRPMLIAAAVVGVTLAPYLYLEVSQGWPDVAPLLEFLRAPKAQDNVALDYAALLIGGGIYRDLLLPFGQEAPRFWLEPLGWVLVALSGAGLGIALWRRGGAYLTVAATLLLPILATLRHATFPVPYYMLPLLPAAAILAGVAAAAAPWRLGLAVAALPVLWELGSYAHFQNTVAADGPRLAYGMPLRYEAAAAALTKSLPSGARVVISEQGNQATTFPVLTRGRLNIVASDSRYGVPLPLAGDGMTPYLVQGEGHVYQFLESHFGPAKAVVPRASGVPAFGLFSLPDDAVARLQSSGEISPVQGDVAHAIAVRGFAVGDLAAGQSSPLMIEWQVTDSHAALPSEVQEFAHLIDSNGVTQSTDIDERSYPRQWWRNGDVVLTWFDLWPKPAAPTGGYSIEAGFYAYPTADAMPVYSPSGNQGVSVRFGPVRVQGAPLPASGQPLANFGGELVLQSADISGQDVALAWRALKQPSDDYTVFVHVLDDSGKLVAQNDSPPQKGSFPTSIWRQGDTVLDLHHLDAVPSGGLHLEIGLYRRPSLQRLTAVMPEGRPDADHVDVVLGPSTMER